MAATKCSEQFRGSLMLILFTLSVRIILICNLFTIFKFSMFQIYVKKMTIILSIIFAILITGSESADSPPIPNMIFTQPYKDRFEICFYLT